MYYHVVFILTFASYIFLYDFHVIFYMIFHMIKNIIFNRVFSMMMQKTIFFVGFCRVVASAARVQHETTWVWKPLPATFSFILPLRHFKLLQVSNQKNILVLVLLRFFLRWKIAIFDFLPRFQVKPLVWLDSPRFFVQIRVVDVSKAHF